MQTKANSVDIQVLEKLLFFGWEIFICMRVGRDIYLPDWEHFFIFYFL